MEVDSKTPLMEAILIAITIMDKLLTQTAMVHMIIQARTIRTVSIATIHRIPILTILMVLITIQELIIQHRMAITSISSQHL
jgi:hypothetical protein